MLWNRTTFAPRAHRCSNCRCDLTADKQILRKSSGAGVDSAHRHHWPLSLNTHHCSHAGPGRGRRYPGPIFTSYHRSCRGTDGTRSRPVRATRRGGQPAVAASRLRAAVRRAGIPGRGGDGRTRTRRKPVRRRRHRRRAHALFGDVRSPGPARAGRDRPERRLRGLGDDADAGSDRQAGRGRQRADVAGRDPLQQVHDPDHAGRFGRGDRTRPTPRPPRDFTE